MPVIHFITLQMLSMYCCISSYKLFSTHIIKYAAHQRMDFQIQVVDLNEIHFEIACMCTHIWLTWFVILLLP
jgi:hypothetical protein